MSDTTPAALVTGVGGYIGAAVAAELRSRGFDVWGIDRVQPAGPEWEGRFIKASLGRGTLPELPMPHLDCVIHVAGGALPAEVDAVRFRADPDLIEATFQDNFLSAVELIDAVRPLLRPAGSILLTSSINALGTYGLPIYSAAKAALHGLVKGLAPELAGEGIRLNVAALGTVDHPGVRRLHADDPDHFERLRQTIPGGVLVTAEVAAERMADTCLDAGLTGQVVVLDGGQLAAAGQ